MHSTSTNIRHRPILGAICLSITLIMAAPAAAENSILGFELALTELNLSLSAPSPIPLASDPGNVLGDSIDGYGFVDSLFTITLSSQRTVNTGPASMGQAVAYQGLTTSPGLPPPRPGDLLTINPAELDGQSFFVDSFFDVFFDITITDVDQRPGRDYAGQPDGASVSLIDNGPARMSSSHEAVFDMDAPNFGLIPPPEANPFTGGDPASGLLFVEIPLGGDINGNGENDKIKLTLALLSLNDQNRTFTELPDGTVINEFDAVSFIQGAIVDESTDPPFTIGTQPPNGQPDPDAFGGPTTATSRLLNPVPPVPVPAAIWLFGTALVGFVGMSRRRKVS